MKLHYVFSCLLFFLATNSTIAKAQNKAQLFLVDQEIDASELKNDFNISSKKADQSVFPEKEVVDNLLNKEEFTKDWDELKKDIFFMELKTKNIKFLVEKYPEVSEKKMKELKNKLANKI